MLSEATTTVVLNYFGQRSTYFSYSIFIGIGLAAASKQPPISLPTPFNSLWRKSGFERAQLQLCHITSRKMKTALAAEGCLPDISTFCHNLSNTTFLFYPSRDLSKTAPRIKAQQAFRGPQRS
jgi:hypothetical protein